MEYYTGYVLKQCIGSEFALTKEEWVEFAELEKYFKGRAYEDVVVAQLPDDVKSHVHPPDFGTPQSLYSTLYRYSGNHLLQT